MLIVISLIEVCEVPTGCSKWNPIKVNEVLCQQGKLRKIPRNVIPEIKMHTLFQHKTEEKSEQIYFYDNPYGTLSFYIVKQKNLFVDFFFSQMSIIC